MSLNKSKQAERRAGGSKVFSGERSKTIIPDHLLGALRDCSMKNKASPSPLEDDEKLVSFISALSRDSSIGFDYGLTMQEIIELSSLWSRLTRNGTAPPPKGLVPERYATTIRLDRKLYAEWVEKRRM